MYYDLIASLPYLPHFERAEWLPITRLRLEQRLRLLRPSHADQLARAQVLVSWRLDRLPFRSDTAQANQYASLMASPLERTLREYVAFRMDQQTLVAALRRRRDGLAPAEGAAAWGVGPWVLHVQMHWDEPDFRLGHLFRWLPQASSVGMRNRTRSVSRRCSLTTSSGTSSRRGLPAMPTRGKPDSGN